MSPRENLEAPQAPWRRYGALWARVIAGFGPPRRPRRNWAVGLLLLAAPLGHLLASPPPTISARWSRFSDVVFRHFTTDTGLPFTGAGVVAQDRQGFLWIGSQSGLARWDGQRFRVYRAADARTGLADDLIKVLHVDPRGRLWVGTNAGGMARYDPAADRFIPYGAGPHGLSHAGVRAIADDGRGGLWVATSGGLDHVDPDARTIRRYRHAAADPASLPADHVSALLRDARGLWVGTAGGLAYLDMATGRFRRLILPGRGAMAQPGVTALTADGGRDFWIGTVAGAYRYEASAHVVTPVIESGAAPALAAQTVNAIARVGDAVWIATGGKGIVILEPATGVTRRIVHDARVPSSLADDAPTSLFRDRGGALWVGSQRALSRYDPTRTGVWTLLGGTQRPGTISSPDVTAVLAAHDGRLWLGLRSGHLEIVDPSRGTIREAAPAGGAPLVAVSSFAELTDGSVAIGTNAGLYRAAPTAPRRLPLGFRGAAQAGAITALLNDRGGLWIGRLDGVWRLGIDRAQHAVPVRLPESDLLADRRVMAIARAADGSLWVGTQNGLYRLVPGTGLVERVRLSGADADGLVPTVLADRRGRIWAGVYGHGLVLIDRGRAPGWRIRHVGVAQGLPDSNVDQLLEDGAGRIWASTDNGLATIDPSHLAVRALRRSDGVELAAYWNGSGARTTAGDLIFGGLGGATIVDPRRVAPPSGAAPLMLTELRAGGREMSGQAFNERRSGSAVTVRPQANSLFAEFAALDYADPDATRYAYRLRGYQDAWIAADAAHRSASYTNLPPGAYVLEVRAIPVRAGQHGRRLDIPVTVVPAWYQTLWFRLGLVALGIGLTFALSQWRTNMLRRQQRELEQLVADRTAALRASQRELEQIAYIDVLTGLPNRRMFNDQLRDRLARADRKGHSAAMLLIDLDRFKTINDRYGHDAGDALLAEVAMRLQAVVGEHDSLARLGGDEFVIVIPDAADLDRIEETCRRIIHAVSQPVSFRDVQFQSGASIGIAIYRHDGANESELYKASDLALYAAKRHGRGSWAWFSETPAAASQGAESRRNRA